MKFFKLKIIYWLYLALILLPYLSARVFGRESIITIVIIMVTLILIVRQINFKKIIKKIKPTSADNVKK